MRNTTLTHKLKIISHRLFFHGITLALIVVAPLEAREFSDRDGRSITAEIQFLGGLQYGTGINFGYGAIDTPGETKRATLSVAAKPVSKPN